MMKRNKLYLPYVLLGLMTLAMILATLVERVEGTDIAFMYFYRSWWFVIMWVITGLSMIYLCFKKHLQKNPPIFMIHCSLLLIILGGILTCFTSKHGEIILRSDNKTSNSDLTLPFDMKLEKFEVKYYQGTDTPQDYVSNIIVTDNNKTERATISMNNIFKCKGYRFYQDSFTPDMKSSTLSISYDPYGITVTYCGYILITIAFIWFLLSKKCTFRRLMMSLSKTYSTEAIDNQSNVLYNNSTSVK